MNYVPPKSKAFDFGDIVLHIHLSKKMEVVGMGLSPSPRGDGFINNEEMTECRWFDGNGNMDSASFLNKHLEKYD